MNSNADSHDLLRKYLLGDVSLDQILQVEERLANDPESRDALGAAEEELIDDYLYEDLSAEELRNFKRHFLTSDERFESLRIARALKLYGERNAAPVPVIAPDRGRGHFPWMIFRWQTPVTAAVVLLLVFGGWLIFRGWRSAPASIAHQSNVPADRTAPSTPSPTDIPPAETTNTPKPAGNKTAPAPVRTPTPRVPEHESNSTLAVFMLFSGDLTRSVDVSRNRVVPGSAKTVILQLPIDAEVAEGKFSAVITDQSNKVVWSRANLRSVTLPTGVVLVSLAVRASKLSPQTYKIQLDQITPQSVAKSVTAFNFYVP